VRVLLLAALLSLGLAGCIHTRVVEDGALQPDGLEHNAVETSRLRRLPFLREVPSEAVDREEQKEFLRRYLDARAAQLDVDTRVYRRLGILGPQQTMRKVLERQFGSAIAGFYTWEGGGRLFVSTDYDFLARMQLEGVGLLTGIDWAYDLVLLHELVHALQDQHYDLARFAGDELTLTNEDLALARTDVIESDAGLAGWAHFHGVTMTGWLERRLHAAVVLTNYGPYMLIPQLAFPGVPAFFSKRSLGHYLRGIGYVNARLDEGGFEALDAAYRAGLVESTEQLLWPDKRTGEGYDPPVVIGSLPEHHELLPGFTRARSNVFGELQWRLLFEDHLLLPGAATAVARGWGGDRYEVYVSTAPGRERDDVFLWRSTWDTVADAEEVERAWRDTVDARYRGDVEAAGDDRWRLPDRRGFAQLARRGRRVVIVEGNAANTQALVEAAFASFDEEARVAPAPKLEPLVAVTRAADATLDVSDRALPPPIERGPTLRDRFFLRQRKVSWAFGVGARIAGDRVPVSLTSVDTPLGPGELRWGFRRGMQWSDPFVLSLEHHSPAGQTVVTGGLTSFPFFSLDGELFAQPLFRATHALHVGERVAFAAQLGGLLQIDTLAPDYTLGLMTVAAGVFARPVDGVTIGVSVARDTVVDFVGPLTGARGYAPQHRPLRVGSAMVRGRAFRQPLLELRVLDVLHLWWASSALVGPTWTVLEQEHAVGAMLYF
jgi:hypothetical protein